MFRTLSPVGLGRKAIISATVAVVVVGGIAGAVIWTGGTSNASPVVKVTTATTATTPQAVAPVTEATPTTAAKTTTTVADRGSKYVGIEHSDSGSGLPVDASIRGGGVYYGNDPKVGSSVMYWVHDAKGEMLFIDHITKISDTNTYYSVQSKVDAVFDMPTLKGEDGICTGWCVNKNGDTQTATVAIYSGESGTATKAWTVDLKKLTLTPASANNVYAWAPEVPPANPPRPELYNVLATLPADSTDQYWYTANEQVTSAGGWAGDDNAFVNHIVDSKLHQDAYVWTKDGKAISQLVVPNTDGQKVALGTDATYKGKTVKVLNIVDAKSDKVWLMNFDTHTFELLNRADVNVINPA